MSHIPPYIISFYCIKSLRHRINSLLSYSHLKIRFFPSRSLCVLRVVVCVIIGDQRAMSFFLFLHWKPLTFYKKGILFCKCVRQSVLVECLLKSNINWNSNPSTGMSPVSFFREEKGKKNGSHQCCEVNLIENHMMWSSWVRVGNW